MTAMLAALALAAVACGSSEDTVDTVPTSVATDSPADQDTGELPVVGDDQVVDTPVVVGMCAEGEPDCEDTAVVDAAVSDLPSPTGTLAAKGHLVTG